MGVTSGDGRGMCSEIIPICTVTPSSVRVDALRFLFLFLNFLAQSKMPYRHVSQDLKERVLSVIDNNVVPDNFELNASEIFGVTVHPRSIQRWQRNIDFNIDACEAEAEIYGVKWLGRTFGSIFVLAW